MQAQSSNTASGLVDVVRRLYRDLSQRLDAPICFFGVYEPALQRVHVVWQVQDDVELPGGAFPLGSGLTSQVIRSRTARLVQDWERQGPAVTVQYATEPPDLPRSAITVPVVVDEMVLGVLSLQSQRAAAFGPDDLEVVVRLVERAAPTIAGLLWADAGDDQAALALDREARLVRLSQGARALLSLQDHSVVFGFPIDQPQAGQWPLGSAALGKSLRSVFDLVQRGEAVAEAEIVPNGDASRVVKCKASALIEAGELAGAVLTLSPIDAPAA